MIDSVRLSKGEKEKLNKKAIEINKILIKKEKSPLRESEIIHKILELSITYVKINEKGELYIDQ